MKQLVPVAFGLVLAAGIGGGAIAVPNKKPIQPPKNPDAISTPLQKGSAMSDIDILLTDLVYPRRVGSNEIFESLEAMQGEPTDEGKDDWSSFHSTLFRQYDRRRLLQLPSG